MKTIIKTAFIAILSIITGIILSVGVHTVYDCWIGDGTMPKFHRLTNPKDQLSSYGCSTACISSELSNEEYWEELQPARQILEKICPEIAEWLNQQYAEDRIDFYNKAPRKHVIATWSMVTGLHLTKLFYTQSEGNKALTFCHEYRHSQQNAGKRLRDLVSAMGPNPQESILENDAYIFEHHAASAIYGSKAYCGHLETAYSLEQNTYYSN